MKLLTFKKSPIKKTNVKRVPLRLLKYGCGLPFNSLGRQVSKVRLAFMKRMGPLRKLKQRMLSFVKNTQPNKGPANPFALRELRELINEFL